MQQADLTFSQSQTSTNISRNSSTPFHALVEELVGAARFDWYPDPELLSEIMNDIRSLDGWKTGKPITLNGSFLDVCHHRYRQRAITFEHKQTLASLKRVLNDVSEEVDICEKAVEANAKDKNNRKRGAELAIDNSIVLLRHLNKRLKSKLGEDDDEKFEAETRDESQELGSIK